MSKFLIVPVDGPPIEDERELTVEFIQSKVGGFFEYVATDHGGFYMHEEARGGINRTLDHAFNYRIRGLCIVAGRPDEDGNDNDILEETADRIRNSWNAIDRRHSGE